MSLDVAVVLALVDEALDATRYCPAPWTLCTQPLIAAMDGSTARPLIRELWRGTSTTFGSIFRTELDLVPWCASETHDI